MLQMSRSTHDILYQGNICMLRRDADIQLVGTDTRVHAGKREPMQISKTKENATLCCRLQQVISDTLQQCTARSGESTQRLSKWALVHACTLVCVCVCVRVYVQVHLHVSSLPPGELKSRTSQKLADSTKPYPTWTLSMWGQLVEEERVGEKEKDKSAKEKKTLCVCRALLVILGRAFVRNP